MKEVEKRVKIVAFGKDVDLADFRALPWRDVRTCTCKSSFSVLRRLVRFVLFGLRSRNFAMRYLWL